MTEVFFREYQKLMEKRESFATAIVVQHGTPISGKVGDKAIIRNDGELQGWIGGGCTHTIVIEEGMAAISSGKSKLIVIDPEKKEAEIAGVKHFNMNCHSGGSLSVYIEPVSPRPLIVVMGDSPVAESLLNFASELGYQTLWAGCPVLNDKKISVDKVMEGFDLTDVNLSSPCFIIVCTQGESDSEALEASLKVSVDYLAFVGSRRKTEVLKNELTEIGLSREKLDKVVNPAGMDLNARTPSEIALSILAEIVKIYRNESTTINELDSESNLNYIDPICGMKVNSEDAKHFLIYKEQNYFFCCKGCKTKFEKNPESYIVTI